MGKLATYVLNQLHVVLCGIFNFRVIELNHDVMPKNICIIKVNAYQKKELPFFPSPVNYALNTPWSICRACLEKGE